MSYGLMSYIVCSRCGDPVGGRIPSGSEPRVLTCVRCHAQTAFNDGDLRQGLVGYDEATRRWRVATLADSLTQQKPTQYYSLSARRFVRQAERRIDRGRNRRGR
jgi:hypothetical protein